MVNKGITIRYGDVAPEAKENFVPSTNESEFDTLSQLNKYNLNFPNYSNPCEKYSVLLDGTATAFPSEPENKNIGMWSKQISNEDGSFTEPIVLTLSSDGFYTSSGLTLTFDDYNQIYPTRLTVIWYMVSDGQTTELSQSEFYPDSAIYFCENKVAYYNKIEIKFYSLNMPLNRLKLRAIDYGKGTIFYGNELRSVKEIQEIDPISSEITINTMDFELDLSTGAEYSFQEKQPLTTYFNGNLVSTTFVKTFKKKSQFLWSIQSEDYIGLMDDIPYYGGIYTNKNATEILSDIFAVAKVPYEVDSAFSNSKVTGYIPYTTCRVALMQVAFAIQAVVDTSNSDVVKIFALDDEIKQTIPLKRIMQGQNFVDESAITGIEVSAHSYRKTSESINVYDATESGTGENIFVKFSEPLHSLNITNGDIIVGGTNYAIINANEGCLLIGNKYEHTVRTRRKVNSIVLASDVEKIIAIDNATLVSSTNINNVLEKCYDWLIKSSSINLKIVEGKHEEYGDGIKYGTFKYGAYKYGDRKKTVIFDQKTNVGENISCETEYMGVFSGRIIKQSFSLNGGIVIKDTQIR